MTPATETSQPQDSWLHQARLQRLALAPLLAATSVLADERRQAWEAVFAGADVDGAGRLALVHDLYAVGRYAGPVEAHTAYLRESAVVGVLVEALADDDAAVVERVVAWLGDATPEGALDPFAERLASLVRARSLRGGERLLARLPRQWWPTAVEAVFAREVRARLGDARSRTEIMAALAGAADFDALQRAAVEAGYAGGDEIIGALIGALGSPLLLVGPYERVSVRMPLIRALGRLHPGVPELTTTIERLARAGDDATGLAGRRAYYESVVAWAEQRYHKAPLAPPADYTFHQQILVKKPEKRQ
ncbi:MAG: hypothetical protein IPK26_26225 [Planctomycetes bacterium]|nr:hypothetical protein [Planctomycetota bacterium]